MPLAEMSQENMARYINDNLPKYDLEVLRCMSMSSLLVLAKNIQPIENPKPIDSTIPTLPDGNRYTRHNNARTHL